MKSGVLLLLLLFSLSGCGGATTQGNAATVAARTDVWATMQANTPTPFVTATPLSYVWFLHCPDCVEAGMPANIWKDESMSSLACRREWGSPVEMLDNSGSDTMYRVVYGDCYGWIRKTLVRYAGE